MAWAEGLAGLMRDAGAKENTSPLYFGTVTGVDPVKVLVTEGETPVAEASEDDDLFRLVVSKLFLKNRRYVARGSWKFEAESEEPWLESADGWWESLQNYIEAGDTAILLSNDGQTFYLVGVF